MEPIVNGLETEFGTGVAFERVDASSDRGQAAMKLFALRGHPSYVLLDENSVVIWQFAGQVGEAKLRTQLTALEP